MTYDPTSGEARDELRLHIGDTGAIKSPALPEVFSDAELNMVLAKTGTDDAGIYAAAAICYGSMAGNRARFAVQWSVMAQDASVDQRSVARELRLQAAEFWKLAASFAVGELVTWTDQNLEHLQDSLVLAGLNDFERNMDETG